MDRGLIDWACCDAGAAPGAGRFRGFTPGEGIRDDRSRESKAARTSSRRPTLQSTTRRVIAIAIKHDQVSPYLGFMRNAKGVSTDEFGDTSGA